jgi:protein-histidine pros-kinase
VIDTGRGIRPEQREKVFEAFEQLGDSATRRREGTGLGLYISSRLAELIGARLSAESEYGEGSTFTLEVGGTR